ncbi:MAG: TonB-dependent receptor domain-containing protein [Bryobacteraceae bacterium]
MKRSVCVAVFVTMSFPALAQESRGAIQGRVIDPTDAPVAGASVLVENLDTGTTVRLSANATGHYEANLLLPGSYKVVAESKGFKKSIRSGIVLPLSTRLEIDLKLEIGTVSDSVTVTGETPMLDTNSASSGMVMDNRSVMDLPVIANNIMVMVKMTPGVQTSGVNDYLGPHSNVGASDYRVAGGVGGNEWSIDGVPNNGASRRSAYLPVSDTIQEMKVETFGFDASTGHSTGVSVTMMTKGGTNQFHGTLTEQHWQQRWHGTPFFTKQRYYRNIAAAEAAGNRAGADALRAQDKQATGRSNNYTGTIGGPVKIPKLFDGKDKLFFFFSYQGNKDKVADLPDRLNKTIPTAADRRGDFSRFLGVNAGLYQLYDPLSARADPARPTHFIRDPIPGNILAPSRIVNPAAPFYTKLLPTPNNDVDPRREPTNNFLALTTPLVRDYFAYSNRIDYQHSNRHRFFGRWSYNDWINNANDWMYDTVRGLQADNGIRTNLGATVDWVFTASSSTVLDVSVSVNNYREGSAALVARQFKPSDAGLPAYLDAKAASQTILPRMSFAGYEPISFNYPTETNFRTSAAKADLTHIRGYHTIRAGADMRGQYRTGGAGGNTSGSFSFDNQYTRRYEDTFAPAGNLAHSWAAFLMGIPSSASVDTTDSYATYNPYMGWYAQDQWRITPKLSLNGGIRVEYEKGPTERYNRAISSFDAAAKLPITDAAQAAYARNPAPELGAADFAVRGGSLYPGSGSGTRQLWGNELMWLPRVGVAYQVRKKTVLRAGYGMYYDTLNVLNEAPDQTGFSRATSTVFTNDFGVNWLAGDPRRGVSPISDPFPVRANGTRFDTPTRDALGLMARAGRGWTHSLYDVRHARQQRWRVGAQQQLGADWLIDAAYAGSYSDRAPLNRPQSPLPEKFWAGGQVRDNNIANNLNGNVTNPFAIGNFSALAASSPLIYQDMTTLGFYTSPTIRKNQLLRAYPQMNGVTQRLTPLGEAKTHEFSLQLQKRFARGYNMNFNYVRQYVQERNAFLNEFDALPFWIESNNGRPHRVTASGIYEFPFGKGRKWAREGILSHALGGFQAAATYEWQPGPLLNWGNLFYSGDTAGIHSGERTLDRWFNTDGFERVAARGPAAFHRRVFPNRIDGARADMTNQWNVNVQRDFRLTERATFQVRVDALNIQNRTQFGDPGLNPFSTDFGRITSQTNTRNRFLQLQGRIRF